MKKGTENNSTTVAKRDVGEATILVADDDDVIRVLVRTLLEKSGYSVVEAVDGNEAVSKFREHGKHIDLLLFDVRMPGKDGKQAYDEVRQIRPDVKVLFVSGYGGDILLEYGVNEKDFEVIPKPFMPADLLLRIKTCLDRGFTGS